MRIIALSSTIGQANPSPVTLSGGYRYRGDPDWVPNHPRYRQDGPSKAPAEAGGAVSAEKRQARIDEFAAVLKEMGYPNPEEAPNAAVIKAGKQIGVVEKTAKSYRTAIGKRRKLEEAAAALAALPEDPEPAEIMDVLHRQIAASSPKAAAVVAKWNQMRAGAVS